MKDVYSLTVIWAAGKIRFPSLLNRTTIGYFSSLSAVWDYFKTAREKTACRWYFSDEVGFRIFEVSKFIANSDEEEQGHWVYDEAGKLYGGYEGSERDKFRGRTPEQCLFKPGDLVGFIEGKRLNAGIVASRPVYAEEIIPYLDQSDDCYMVLTVNMITGKRSHTHPWVHHVFDLERFMSPKLREKLRDFYDKGT